MKFISSAQNTYIKQLLQLKEKSRERRKRGLFLIEGQRELSLAIEGRYQIDDLLFCRDLVSESQLNVFKEQCAKITEISMDVFQKLAHRDSTEGVIALAKEKTHELETLQLGQSPLILIAEAPEKPGNIGALLRTADAAHLDAVIIANPKTDLYNPNIIRSSVGCVFTNQIAMASTTEILTFLKDNTIDIYCAALQASVEYHTQNYSGASALVVGTEADGLSEEWLNNASQNVRIPMQGKIDSMNVSVAAGILIFEAKRQRNFQ